MSERNGGDEGGGGGEREVKRDVDGGLHFGTRRYARVNCPLFHQSIIHSTHTLIIVACATYHVASHFDR